MKYFPGSPRFFVDAREHGHIEPRQDVKDDSLRVQIARHSRFHDGKELLLNFTTKDVPLEITFADEKAIGIGPTHEFLFCLLVSFATACSGLPMIPWSSSPRRTRSRSSRIT
jgi:hypothetical protein